MKNFNQMTERQMSKTNGGLLNLLITAFCLFTTGVGVAGGITGAIRQNNENAGRK